MVNGKILLLKVSLPNRNWKKLINLLEKDGYIHIGDISATRKKSFESGFF